MTAGEARPPISRREEVVEVLHGRPVADPYRWLEDAGSADVQQWLAEQERHARGVLDILPGRDRIAARLGELFATGDVSAPVVRGGRSFYLRRAGQENQPVLWMRTGAGPDERRLVDPNERSAEGTVAIDWWYPSPDGRRLAYGLSAGGDELSTLHVLDTERGEDLPDRIPNTRAASLAWLPDGTGFYYTRYPAAGEIPAGEEMYHRQVFFHRLGTDSGADPHVFGEGRAAEDWPGVQLSPDGRYLLVTVSRGWDRTDCYLRTEGSPPGPFLPLIEGEPVLSSGHLTPEALFLLTNLDAPKFRVLAIDPAHPARESWREVVAERADAVLQEVLPAGGRLLLSYLADASSQLVVAAADGSPAATVPLPTIGSVDGLSGEWDQDEAFFLFSSFTVPPSVYRYDLADGSCSLWARVDAARTPNGAAGHESPPYEIRRERFPSADGTVVPMFIVVRRGVPLDGQNPTVLTGYGGFGISLTPSFSRSALFWLEQGGVYAVANLRGGGEFGESWHQDGMLGRKQHVFDDFIAAAEHLCRRGYTNPARLAISGGSNGGLLVGAALTQRPELFRAAVCAVPLLDMLRYHRFRIARLWIPEYGSAEDPEQIAWLAAYSPYHRVRDGTAYPAVLLLTGESDTRVDPLHARKMTARLQAASTSGLPILLRVESEAGHGAGRPRDKTLAEQIDVWSFLCWQLGVTPA